jgi:hypothetical protein
LKDIRAEVIFFNEQNLNNVLAT